MRIVRNTRRPTYARAVALEVDGTPPGARPVKSAAGIVRWRFVFDNQSTRNSFYRRPTIDYRPHQSDSGPVVGHRSPLVEDLRTRRAPRMTLAEAVSRLRQAGYRRAFYNVTLRNPLGPRRGNPLYIFGFAGNDYVAVNALTGKAGPLA